MTRGKLWTPREGYPFSLDRLRHNLRDDVLRGIVGQLCVKDIIYFFDDFHGDAINLDNYAVANGGGSGVASFAINVQKGGVIRATTGTANDATASASLIMPLNWYGDGNAGMEVRWKLETSVAAYKMEIGFADAVPGSNTGVVNDEDTPTGYGADFAIFSIDTAETHVTGGFYTDGSTTDQGIKRSSLTGIPGMTNGITPVISTYYTTRIELNGNTAACWVNGKLVAVHDDDPEGNVEGGVALAPWIYLAANSATSKSLDIDYIAAWQDRG